MIFSSPLPDVEIPDLPLTAYVMAGAAGRWGESGERAKHTSGVRKPRAGKRGRALLLQTVLSLCHERARKVRRATLTGLPNRCQCPLSSLERLAFCHAMQADTTAITTEAA